MSSRPVARSFPKFPLLLSDYNWLHIVHRSEYPGLELLFARVCLAFGLLALSPDQAKNIRPNGT
jgi:hypothetical protein